MKRQELKEWGALKSREVGVRMGKEGNEGEQWVEAVWHQIGPHRRVQTPHHCGWRGWQDVLQIGAESKAGTVLKTSRQARGPRLHKAKIFIEMSDIHKAQRAEHKLYLGTVVYMLLSCQCYITATAVLSHLSLYPVLSCFCRSFDNGSVNSVGVVIKKLPISFPFYLFF